MTAGRSHVGQLEDFAKLKANLAELESTCRAFASGHSSLVENVSLVGDDKPRRFCGVCAVEARRLIKETFPPPENTEQTLHEALTKGLPPPGVKHDAGKPRMDRWTLLPPHATAAVVRVLVFGVKKYSAWGWQKVVGWRWRYTAALLRHVFAYARGEARDPETGEHHLAHAGCCLLFLLDNELRLEAGHRDVPDGDTEEVAR